MFKTRITEMFGIQYPIIEGALAGLSKAELAAAVSNAGGLGQLVSTFPTMKEFRDEIKKTKSLTDKPIAVNVTFIRRPKTPEEAATITANIKERITVAIEEGVRIFEVAGGNPAPYMKLFKDANAKVMDKVGRVADAKLAEDLGVDAVTVVGFEAGGHPGIDNIGSLVSIPAATDIVKIPVIAAGGIGDGRGLVAALALGAEAVLVGTRFLASQECHLSAEERARLIEAQENETVLVEHGAKTFARRLPTTKQGDVNTGRLCGQVVGLVHDIPSVKEIIDRMVSDAILVNQRLNRITNQV